MHCWFTVSYLRCRFDYLATHWYSKTQNATETISALREYSERYGGLRIWFTEFAVRQVGPEPGAGPGPGAGPRCCRSTRRRRWCGISRTCCRF